MGLFGRLVYPPFCFHCSVALKNGGKLLCQPCEEMLELIDPEQRCQRCFTADFNDHPSGCSFCYHCSPLFYRFAAAFDYVGPAASLVKHLKYRKCTFLAETLTAFLVAQFSRLNWPIPDVLVPVPISFAHRTGRGYNQSQLIADSFGNMIDRPVYDVLRRSSDDLSQAGLSRWQRMQLNEKGFSIKKNNRLHDKIILLIDDVMTTGTTLNKCVETLWEAAPSVVYAITVCRTLR